MSLHVREVQYVLRVCDEMASGRDCQRKSMADTVTSARNKEGKVRKLYRTVSVEQ